MQSITLATINERLQSLERLLVQLLHRLDEDELSDEARAALDVARATPLEEYVPLE